MAFKPFKAQTRLWGYALGHAWEEQEMSNVLVEAATPVKDQTETANDYSPLQAERSWRRQAEDNVADSMERLGLMRRMGTWISCSRRWSNNLEVTNELEIQPDVRAVC